MFKKEFLRYTLNNWSHFTAQRTVNTYGEVAYLVLWYKFSVNQDSGVKVTAIALPTSSFRLKAKKPVYP